MRAENWRPVTTGGKGRGRADLHLDSGMIIRGVMLVAGTSGLFVSLPQSAWMARDGAKRYSPIIEFSDKVRERAFLDAALDAVVELSEAHGADGAHRASATG